MKKLLGLNHFEGLIYTDKVHLKLRSTQASGIRKVGDLGAKLYLASG